jgi:hypothetical protein
MMRGNADLGDSCYQIQAESIVTSGEKSIVFLTNAFVPALEINVFGNSLGENVALLGHECRFRLFFNTCRGGGMADATDLKSAKGLKTRSHDIK